MMWLVFGFAFSFGPSVGGLIGAPVHIMWLGVHYDTCGPHANNIPGALYALFQMMFATITPLLMTGSFAERLKWKCFLVFIVVWEIFVYYPVCHWIWGGGFLHQWGVIDFAGGIVIHVSAGAGALVVALFLGKRKDFHQFHGEFPPSNLPLAAVGTALLWMGWFGFNGGSALVGGELAVSAVVSTHMSACCSACVTLVLASRDKRPGATAIFNGVLAGLAGITAASGYVSTQATILIGGCSGALSYYGMQLSKNKLHIDDALDVHWVHGATGIVGAIALGIFGRSSAVEQVRDMERLRISWNQVGVQIVGVTVVGVYSASMTYFILKCMAQHFGTLALDEDEQHIGLDWIDHGEVAYHKINVLSSVVAATKPEGGKSLHKSNSYDNIRELPSEEDYFCKRSDTELPHTAGFSLLSRPNMYGSVNE
eukprot:GHVU01096990.1.p1 GENE.GHVU01096990.1~~GHVU01096990.1.p1  ORF type:complete len:425 (-),score=31.59 GHVU01096990.1:470-1744(-)